MTPSIIIQCDPETLKPTAVFLNGDTDAETAKLKALADKMLAAVEGQ